MNINIPICWRREACVCGCTCSSSKTMQKLIRKNLGETNEEQPWLLVLWYDMFEKERKCLNIYTDWSASTRWRTRSEARREATRSLESAMDKVYVLLLLEWEAWREGIYSCVWGMKKKVVSTQNNNNNCHKCGNMKVGHGDVVEHTRKWGSSLCVSDWWRKFGIENSKGLFESSREISRYWFLFFIFYFL